MWEFRNSNTFGALAFPSFGAFWLSFAALVAIFGPQIPTANAGDAIGLYLWAWAIFTTYMFVASLRTTAAVPLVLALLATTFILLAAGEVGANTTVTRWGGYIGLATAAAAWYASFAIVTNSTFKRTILPVIPLSRRLTDLGRMRSSGGPAGPRRPPHSFRFAPRMTHERGWGTKTLA